MINGSANEKKTAIFVIAVMVSRTCGVNRNAKINARSIPAIMTTPPFATPPPLATAAHSAA